jgi:predicted PurR-regulated permease PerM
LLYYLCYYIFANENQFKCKIYLFIANFLFVIILALLVFGSFYSQSGNSIDSTYDCNNKKISVIKHFQNGADLYINNNWYLELITDGKTNNNIQLQPKISIFPRYKKHISTNEQKIIADCIPEISK